MNTPDTILTVAEIILFAALTTGSVYLIIVLSRALKTLDKIDKEITGIENNVLPLLSNMNKVIIDAGAITGKLINQIDDISALLTAYKKKGEDILEYLNKAEAIV